MWESPTEWVDKFFQEELEAHVPRDILKCKEVSREVNFSSAEKMVTLHTLTLTLTLTQRMCVCVCVCVCVHMK
jgi:hypothetical protein